MPGSAQDLLIALCSLITPGGARETHMVLVLVVPVICHLFLQLTVFLSVLSTVLEAFGEISSLSHYE